MCSQWAFSQTSGRQNHSLSGDSIAIEWKKHLMTWPIWNYYSGLKMRPSRNNVSAMAWHIISTELCGSCQWWMSGRRHTKEYWSSPAGLLSFISSRLSLPHHLTFTVLCWWIQIFLLHSFTRHLFLFYKQYCSSCFRNQYKALLKKSICWID